MSTSLITTLSEKDLIELRSAKKKMEEIGWAMKGLNRIGGVLETGIDKLPQKQQKWLQQLAHKVLHTVVKANLKTMKKGKTKAAPSNRTYKALVTSSGIVGGAFGATAFAVDLTVATKFMMRSIMDIARSEGEDLSSYDTQLACLQVLALGGKSKHDDNLDTGYYATRVALSSAVKNATSYASKHGMGAVLQGSNNTLMKLIGAIASRFSIQVSEKFVAQAIPVIGAAGGGSVNLAFINHFQNMAKAHFTIRRLERKYGEAMIKGAYEGLEING
ncbi:EcsC family protein [Maribacter algarum]|uniref:EcsC family protein n=1 Tax=Maribacter algarum (ex Zhang et al. 2020) TaxID=2578118 RepID=A0A5S3PRY0_9FLAO|nr:EcsC family protein [Maribacter algarum]TMM57497.1 EcsC family protein [Maribacter algarum]